MSQYDPTTDKEMGPTPFKKIREAESIFDYTVREQREIFRFGNRGVIEAGLCDGQTCINHWVKPYGVKGCACRLAKPGTPDGLYFKERHERACSQNGENTQPDWGCKAFKSDPNQWLTRLKPAYMKKVYGRKVI